MHIDCLTLFPEMFDAIEDHGISARAFKQGLVTLRCINPRDFTKDKHRRVDDRPYGGGPGMVMSVQPLRDALAHLSSDTEKGHVIYLSPQGRPLQQEDVIRLSREKHLVLVAGRYEGVDERFIERDVDEEISIGDYVLSGGELASMVLIDALIRMIPGALGDEASGQEDSFMAGLLDYPHYTRPEEVDGQHVPTVLLNGDHAAINAWRRENALGRTFERRPDVFERYALSAEDQVLLERYLARCGSAGSVDGKNKER